VMRIRALFAIALLVLPAAAEAQRVRTPRLGGRGGARPAELPPQAPTISRELAYRRLPVSFESYSLMTYVRFPGFGDGVVSKGTTFGAGTRMDYRLSRFMSGTLDMTSSFIGGPAITQTAELGTRFHTARSEGRVYPFVDVRAGYLYAYNRNFQSFDDQFVMPPQPQFGYVGQFSHGFGGIAGGGLEYSLTRRFSLTTAASVMRTRMRVGGFQSFQPEHGRYWMTSYRYVVALRYNPVRLITP
jgi:hypothetical protein